MLRYFNFEPSFKLGWCHARDLENSFFDKRCNRRYGLEKGDTATILKARKFSRTELLNNQSKKENEEKPVLNVTYHPSSFFGSTKK